MQMAVVHTPTTGYLNHPLLLTPVDLQNKFSHQKLPFMNTELQKKITHTPQTSKKIHKLQKTNDLYWQSSHRSYSNLSQYATHLKNIP